jgi:hypothetical protein
MDRDLEFTGLRYTANLDLTLGIFKRASTVLASEPVSRSEEI